MSKHRNTQHRTARQHPLTKIIVEKHYVGTEKMETVFKRIAEEQITKDDGMNNESKSISTQKTMLKDYAKHNGFLNCQFYVDDGYSGTKTAPVVELIFSIAEEGSDREQQKKELRQCKQCVSEIENLYAKVYEYLTRELLTEKCFQKQISGYAVITELNFKIINQLIEKILFPCYQGES